MKICVYSVLIGDYEGINEQPITSKSNVPFIMFTDRRDLVSKTWNNKCIEPMFPLDSVRSQRKIKLQPHLYLEEFDVSLYIDNSVVLKTPPEIIINRFLSESFDLVAFKHSFRETLLDEFKVVIEQSLDNPHRILKQLNDYRITDAELLEQKPIWSGLLIRRHNKKHMMSFSDIWCSHVMRYSRRDQLSINYAIKHSKVNVSLVDLDNHKTDFHRWPVLRNRKHDKRIYTPTDTSNNSIQEHMLIIEQDFPINEITKIQSSKSNRMPKLLRYTVNILRKILNLLQK